MLFFVGNFGFARGWFSRHQHFDHSVLCILITLKLPSAAYETSAVWRSWRFGSLFTWSQSTVIPVIVQCLFKEAFFCLIGHSFFFFFSWLHTFSKQSILKRVENRPVRLAAFVSILHALNTQTDCWRWLVRLIEKVIGTVSSFGRRSSLWSF